MWVNICKQKYIYTNIWNKLENSVKKYKVRRESEKIYWKISTDLFLVFFDFIGSWQPPTNNGRGLAPKRDMFLPDSLFQSVTTWTVKVQNVAQSKVYKPLLSGRVTENRKYGGSTSLPACFSPFNCARFLPVTRALHEIKITWLT